MGQRWFLAVVLVLAGCDSADDATGGSDAVDSASSDVPDASADAIVPDASADVTVNCSGTGTWAFDSLQATAKTCQTDNDCFIASHQTDCCGTRVAYGLNKSAQAQFQAAESVCDSQYPGCGCPPAPTQAEDGFSATTPADLLIGCIAGTCRTLVKTTTPVCAGAVLQAPKPFKWCGADADCEFSSHQIDCCGSLVFTGIAKSAKPAFDAAEKACTGTAICNCVGKPTTLDDGQVLTTNAVPVHCVKGACWTGKF